MVSSVIQWVKFMLIIYFDAQIVPVLLVEALPTYFCVLLTCSHHSFLAKDVPGSSCTFPAQAWNESFL